MKSSLLCLLPRCKKSKSFLSANVEVSWHSAHRVVCLRVRYLVVFIAVNISHRETQLDYAEAEKRDLWCRNREDVDTHPHTSTSMQFLVYIVFSFDNWFASLFSQLFIIIHFVSECCCVCASLLYLSLFNFKFNLFFVDFALLSFCLNYILFSL